MRQIFRITQSLLRHPAAQGHEAAVLKRFLAWQIASRILPGDALVDWVEGTRLVVRRGETGVTGNVYLGLHEFHEMCFLLHLLRQEDSFVDVGANAGSYSVLAAGVCEAQTIAIEPVPDTFARLRLNIVVNGLASRVQLVNAGAGAESGELYFSTDADTMNRVLSEQESLRRDSELVPVRPLDTLLESVSPTLVKIDVEGFETEVLAGASKLLSEKAPLAVQIEINGSGEVYGNADATILETMDAHGYRPYSYEGRARELTAVDAVELEPANLLFIRDPDTVSERLKDAPIRKLFCGAI